MMTARSIVVKILLSSKKFQPKTRLIGKVGPSKEEAFKLFKAKMYSSDIIRTFFGENLQYVLTKPDWLCSIG